MNKLKTQNFNNLLNYQHFLKNNSLKKKRFKLKNILFENQILYKNQDLNIIELKNSENIQIPTTVLDLKNTYTIQTLYENQLLFNYNLNYNILYNFNKIMFNYIKEKKNNIIKGRIMGGDTNRRNKRRVVIASFGIVFSMKNIHLNKLINNKKFFYLKKKNFKYGNSLKKKNFKYMNSFNFNKSKKKKIQRIINAYKLRYLNFKIVENKSKNILSRISYVEDIVENKRLRDLRMKDLKKRMILERNKKKKSNLSRKGYGKKQKK